MVTFELLQLIMAQIPSDHDLQRDKNPVCINKICSNCVIIVRVTSGSRVYLIDAEEMWKNSPWMCWHVYNTYLHGASFSDSDLEVLPFPTLLHDVSEDDLAVPACSCQLSAISRPGQAEHTACVWLLQCIRPLRTEKGGQRD